MTQFNSVKDSGKRETFNTGSRRDTRKGKGRFDLISPIFLERLAIHLENGAEKYGDRNWEKGQPLMRYLDSAPRHLNKYKEGHRDEDHLAAAAWNLMAFIHTEEMIKRGRLPASLDDRPESLLPVPQKPADPVQKAPAPLPNPLVPPVPCPPYPYFDPTPWDLEELRRRPVITWTSTNTKIR